ncbi:MAG: CoA transferase [Alphaproteobacteria bacterium]
MAGPLAGPLEGLRVLDLSTVILGPWISVMLGDWGADVIKIEPPGGDTTRSVGSMRNPRMASLFMNCNRNKRSITMDLARPSAQAAFRRLVKSADIVVHNMRPRPAAKLGLSWAELSAINPRLILCVALGYGRGGPYADLPAYDDLIQGISGVAGLIGHHTEGDPRYVPTAFADKVGSLTALSGILAALYRRERTGKGQEIEMPMFEAMVSFLLVEHLTGSAFEPPLGPDGYIRQMSPLRRPFKTKDGFIAATPFTDRHWERFFALGGEPDLIRDPRFNSIVARTDNMPALYVKLGQMLAKQTTAYWLDALAKADIPVAPVNSLDAVMKDRHLEAVGFFSTDTHPTEGTVRRTGSAISFFGSPANSRRPAPRLGEHSVEVLSEAGFSPAEIEALIAEKAVSMDGAKPASGKGE